MQREKRSDHNKRKLILGRIMRKLNLYQKEDSQKVIVTKKLKNLKRENIIVGSSHVFIKSKEKVFVGGCNYFYQLGTGDLFDRFELSENVKVDLSKFKAISCHLSNHCLFVSSNGTVFGSGNHMLSQLGDRRQQFKEITPLPFFKGKKVGSVFTGTETSFFETISHKKKKFYVCGSNFFGQLGIGHRNHFVTSPKILKLGFLEHKKEEIADIKGTNHTLILSNMGNVYECGRLPTKCTSKFRINEFFKENNIKIISINCGFNFSVFLSTDHKVYIKGSKLFKKKTSIPKQLNQISNVIKIQCGGDHAFFITKYLDIYVMGINKFKQLCIDQNLKRVTTPTKINWGEQFGKHPFVDVFTGMYTTYFVNSIGKIYTLGHNRYGSCILGKEEKKKTVVPTPTEIKNIQIIPRFSFSQDLRELIRLNKRKSRFQNVAIIF